MTQKGNNDYDRGFEGAFVDGAICTIDGVRLDDGYVGFTLNVFANSDSTFDNGGTTTKKVVLNNNSFKDVKWHFTEG